VLLGRVVWRGREYPAERHGAGAIVIPGQGEVPAGDVRPLAPCRPSKIVAVGRNYREHAKELGNPMPERPLLFLKPPSSLLDPGGAIILPPDSSRVEYEGEIAVVIARECRLVREDEDPMAYVQGVTPLNDVTARDLQKLDVQFTRAKSFDTFCPVGPWIVPEFDMENLCVRTFLNGAQVQCGWARDMAFPIPEIVRFVSRVMTLLPGDILATGTPAGVGLLSPGDTVTVEVAGVRLENTVRAQDG
jgi:2-keto-4-pentenoate hydratase/2-oxohepta-3-ene-1,7-dioic acid hydratase in catechol pathway